MNSFAPCSSLRLLPRAAGLLLAALVPLPLFSAETLPYQDRTLPVEKRVADLLGRMTTEEKIGQLQSQFINNKTKLDEKKQPRDPNVGFTVNYARTPPDKPAGIAD